MRFYFETSGLNSLRNDPNVLEIVEVIRNQHETWISPLNLCEIAGTSNKIRRLELFILASSLSVRSSGNGFNILPVEPELLKQDLRHYLTGKNEVYPSESQLETTFLEILSRPHEIVDDFIATLWLNQNRRTEERTANGFRNIRSKANAAATSFSENDREILTADAPEFMRRISEETDILRGMIEDTLASPDFAVYRSRAMERIHDIFNNIESWRCFTIYHLLELYNRLIRSSHFGPRTNPGWYDTKQIVYVSKVDVFVSDDHRQRNFTKDIVQLAGLQTHVTGYDQLISFLA
jgi:hypothetical protein